MYNLGNASPVVNPGYYDVPIENQYSNPVRGGNERRVSNYNFNTVVGDTINDNDDNYEVSAMSTTPSPSLYVEQNAPMAGYEYGNNLGLYNHVLPQKRQFYRKQVPGGYVPPQVVEGFENSIENYQGMEQPQRQLQNRVQRRRSNNPVQNGMIRSGGAGGVRPSRTMIRAPRQSISVNADGARRDGERTVGYQQLARNQQISQHRRQPRRHHFPRRHYGRRPRHHPGYYYDDYIPVDYINIGSIPNIAGFYDNMEDDDDNYEDDIYDDIDMDDEEVNIKELQNVKIENIKEMNNNDNDEINTSDNQEDSESINTSESSKKKNKKNKKMKSNPIYLVIFLLIILIIILLFFIVKNKKRVRF